MILPDWGIPVEFNETISYIHGFVQKDQFVKCTGKCKNESIKCH